MTDLPDSQPATPEDGAAGEGERAALRWHARLEQEIPTLAVEESLLALAALAALDRVEKDGTAQEALLALCRRHGIIGPKLWQV